MTRTYRRSARALWRTSLRGVVVLGPDGDEVRHLSPPGDAVWELLAEPRTVEQLVAILSERFDGPRATIRSDVEQLLADLTDLDLLV